MNRIKKNDDVIITIGKDSGKTGSVTSVDGDRVIVAGCNMKTKHVKPNPNSGEVGGRIQQEGPVHISNVRLVEDGKPVKVGFRIEDDKKVRYSKVSGKVI